MYVIYKNTYYNAWSKLNPTLIELALFLSSSWEKGLGTNKKLIFIAAYSGTNVTLESHWFPGTGVKNH